jgi:dihydrofolate reductase
MAPRIALIWAMTRNGVIGRDNGLPWRLPKEMQYFMRTTLGHPVVMGRRTFESMDKPLPRRTNIVVTRDPDYRAEGAQVRPDLDAALALAAAICERDGRDTIYVIGGADIYRQSLPVATHLYVTQIDTELAGDTVFPEIDWSDWQRVRCEEFPADDKHAWPFTISVWERRNNP